MKKQSYDEMMYKYESKTLEKREKRIPSVEVLSMIPKDDIERLSRWKRYDVSDKIQNAFWRTKDGAMSVYSAIIEKFEVTKQL